MNKKLKKGDEVLVLIGKDKGKRGKIVRVLAKKGQVLIEGVNIVKKHVKAQGKDRPGGIIDLEKPLPAFRVAVFCSKCQKAARVAWLISEGGKKERICSRCQTLLEKKGK